MKQKNSLIKFDEFPPTSISQWEKLVVPQLEKNKQNLKREIEEGVFVQAIQTPQKLQKITLQPSEILTHPAQIFEAPTKGNYSDQIIGVIKKCETEFQKQKESNFKLWVESSLFVFYVGSKLVAETSKLLAFKKVLYQLSVQYKCPLTTEPQILLKASANNKAAYPEMNLIALSIQALIAKMVGVQQIELESYTGKNNKIAQAYSNNIWKILELESKLDASNIPAYGSAILEDASGKLAKKAFSILYGEDKKFTNFSFQITGVLNKHQFEQYLSGVAPFLKGPYLPMYLTKPWTIRQYAGFSTAKDSNQFYLNNIKAGQKGLSVAFDLPTHRGYDSDHEKVKGDVGMAGVAIDTVEDMKILFKGIKLSDISVSMTMNGAVLPTLAFYIVCAKEQGVFPKQLSGTIQNDILKEFMVRNTFIYPPQPSMRITQDIFKYCSKHMPLFNPISVSGYHIQEAGGNTTLELAYTLADGWEYLKAGMEAGMDIDDFAPRISFFWGIGMDFMSEVAKMRAGRMLWAKIVKQYHPKNEKSLALRTHCQTSGWSLSAQNPYNNIARTTIEALAAVVGHTQSLHTNAFDEALALPSEFSAKIARDTQLYLINETDICEFIDPLGGSDLLAQKTSQLMEDAWELIMQIQSIGGMTKAIEQGIPQSNIAQAAAKKQALIDAKQEIIVGVNAHAIADNSEIELLEVDAQKVRKQQVLRLKKIKNSRDNSAVQELLKKIENAAQNGKQNLLDLAVQAAEKRATLGEISYALEKVWGRYEKQNHLGIGIYGNIMAIKDSDYKDALQLSDKFAQKEGRRPRMLVAKLGQDGHDRGAKIIATSFADMGFDVDISPLFQTPQQVVHQAIDNDVHLIGISSLAGGHKTLVPEITAELKKRNREDILVIVGGVIPKRDYDFLFNKGVMAIFGPGTKISLAAKELLKLMLDEK